MKKKLDFEKGYFEGYYHGIGDFTIKRDQELVNWFMGIFGYINKSYPIKKGGNKKVIEFGCATGVVSKLMSNFGWKVVGTDISNYAVKKAQKNYKGIRFLQHDMEKPFKKDKFDLAIAFDVIEHLPHPSEGIKNTYDLLKKGGSVIFTTPNDYPHVWNDPTHVNVKKPEEWRKILEKAGFKNIFIKQITLIPYFYRWHHLFSKALPFGSSSPYFISPVIIFAKK